MNDQATQLRRLVAAGAPAHRAVVPSPRPPARPWPAGPNPGAPVRLAQAVAVTSGKGGVGKTNVAISLAVCLARLGRRVCLLDADLGLANADVLCNLTPRLTLEHVVGGRCRLAESMLPAPGGFRLIPGACGVSRLADLPESDRSSLLRQLSALESVADDLLIDTAAGLSANVLAFAASAGRVVIVTTPEPTAMTDGYGTVKALLRRRSDVRIDLVVNMVRNEEEGRSVFCRMNGVSRTFLGTSLAYGGSIPRDPAVTDAVRLRVPFALAAPEAPATRAVRRLALRLAGLETSRPGAGFFARLSTWLSGAESP